MALWVALAVIALFALFPVYWMVLTSVTPREQVFEFPPSFIPTAITFEHYVTFFETPALLKYMVNSILVSGVTAFGAVIVSSYAAYSLSKFEYRGRKSVMYMIWSSQMFPNALLLITLYLMFDNFGLLDTHLALILSFMTFTLPLCTFVMKGYFDTIPTEVIEAARIDGARERVITTKVLLPIALPGMVAAGLFAFIRGWNDFIFALTLVGPDRRTLPPGLVIEYLGEFQADWPELMASSFITSIPVVIAFMALQKYFVEGLNVGSVKG
ncbi:carbohydrate ABC transporter permease [Actinobacteria bacterium YIM 96077]|uniref:Carbohydrate ABC transporter permease n=2 Tax=Phytoactinopolyspora halophila TaxID=1981511 RepID=A0A329QHA9_9ACTN|nr:carbohydrate ABC transporter permease [Actinobacteria bacterium YIM 96077]RAW09718.1 carbohydrate ABC transporter permease [Phytoactinopolyspora halophila]